MQIDLLLVQIILNSSHQSYSINEALQLRLDDLEGFRTDVAGEEPKVTQIQEVNNIYDAMVDLISEFDLTLITYQRLNLRNDSIIILSRGEEAIIKYATCLLTQFRR